MTTFVNPESESPLATETKTHADEHADVYSAFTADLVKEINALPLNIERGVLNVLCQEPHDIFLQHRLEKLVGMQVVLHEGDLNDIEKRLANFHEKYDQLEGMSEEFKLEIVVDDGKNEVYRNLSDGSESDGPIVKLINTIISTALKKRVSDIHIECHEYAVKVKYRIDGVLYPATEDLDKAFHSSLISRLKVMTELDIAERRVPQDGRFKLRIAKRDIDFRLSVIPSLFGENVVIRVLDNLMVSEKISDMSLDLMGMDGLQLSTFKKAINEPHGMVLVTGPTGSGKTTTLYAAINAVNDGQQKIITIEDPVEYHLDGVMQIPVNVKKGLTFAKGLRSILRHDPDKILVGEIRDGETAEIAIQSALTGHLVFSSVHANNAYDVLARLQNIGASLSNCLSALNCIVSQRLVRLNCKHCIEPIIYESNYLDVSGISGDLRNIPFYKSRGCAECAQTGFSGRQMICEILLVTEEFRKWVFDGSSINELVGKANLVGSQDLRQSALKLVMSGHTCLEEINRVTFSE